MIRFYFQKIDWFIYLVAFFLILFGLLNLYSLNIFLFKKQFLFSFLFFLISFLIIFVDWRFFINQKWFLFGFYFLSLLLLALTLFQPVRIKGAKNWLILGGFSFQPVELLKIAVILVLANFFSKKYFLAWFNKNIIQSFFYVLLPIVIMLFQPDFGSIVVLLFLWLSFLLVCGINFKKLLFIIILGGIIFLILWHFYFLPYQKERIIAFLFPNYDPLGANYNIIQSKIAIGSAGIFGKGFKEGSQAKLGFLPEAHTDFAFASLTEQFGLIFSFLLFAFYYILIYRLLKIALKINDNFSKFLVLGVVINILISIFLNIGSNLGLLPVTGLPLPFISYGGSHLLTLGIMLGIIQRINLDF